MCRIDLYFGFQTHSSDSVVMRTFGSDFKSISVTIWQLSNYLIVVPQVHIMIPSSKK